MTRKTDDIDFTKMTEEQKKRLRRRQNIECVLFLILSACAILALATLYLHGWLYLFAKAPEHSLLFWSSLLLLVPLILLALIWEPDSPTFFLFPFLIITALIYVALYIPYYLYFYCHGQIKELALVFMALYIAVFIYWIKEKIKRNEC
ncbi:MAG: hypothetical protein PHC97_04485 [Patescibacteria group bacterium]|nr:hypothetical protein [Patescibacteria group bacterium]